MDLRALRYFVETARHASFTRAADVLHVTQSTVSKMIRQLEEELGSPLLLREGRTVRLTDMGERVYLRGQEALGVVARLQTELQDTASLARGTLTIGLPPMINLLFAPALKAFRLRYPGLRIVLDEGTGQDIERRVASGELEVGATVLPAAPGQGLETRPLASYPIVAVGAADAAWAGRAGVPLSALRKDTLVLLDDAFALDRHLRKAFARAGFTPAVATRSGHWEFVAEMARAGLGTALLPEPLVARLPAGDHACARLVRPELRWQVGAIWAAGRYMSHAARAWLALCDELMGADAPPAR